MKPTVNLKWCRKNLERFSQPVFDVLREEHPELNMSCDDCLNACGLCIDVPFAIRNTGVVAARDARGLYHKLKRGTTVLTAPPLPGTYRAVMAASHPEDQA
ncbi:DUF1450 domain-containing protein [Alicyclobacillus shizuokensis]|uniref:DUF1450 domain-containing protein n=1 Tax=Alicyclobacillus shizuokensis TaxID=392014 RepID=UPI00082CAB39|nr:DUF1450 domain-containing protein [Alicyclobacillus shizuokensis]MCL6625031.1 YuzB family protein [Alicyclobacillus shizuokensis]